MGSSFLIANAVIMRSAGSRFSSQTNSIESSHSLTPISIISICSDPSDDMLLEVAVAANATYIITFNISDFKAVRQFNIKVIKPKDFLTLIGEI